MKQLWSNGPYYRDEPAFKITTDSVLLSHFSASGNSSIQNCLDIGCGGGLISVLIHAQFPDACFDSFDIRMEAVQICRENYDANHIEGSVECLDVREYRSASKKGIYDLVVCNPPYYYTGKISPDKEKAVTRGDTLSPAQFSGAASYFLRKGGSFCVVHKPAFLADIFAAMRLADIEPKRMRFVSHRLNVSPSLVLIEGRRSGNTGLEIMPTLYISNPDGSATEEIQDIYHLNKTP